MFCQQDAVGGQGHLVDSLDRHQARDERGKIAADERFAAGQPNRADAQQGRRPHHANDLLVAEQVLPREKERFGGHAVAAADVAAVGHADPQIGVPTAEAVDQPSVSVSSLRPAA